MILKSISVRSAAKLAGLLYVLMGLVIGAIVSLVALLGLSVSGNTEEQAGFLFGVGAVVFIPVFYGVAGYIGTAIATALFNLVAGWAGGLEIDIEMSQVPQPPQVGSEPLSQ